MSARYQTIDTKTNSEYIPSISTKNGGGVWHYSDICFATPPDILFNIYFNICFLKYSDICSDISSLISRHVLCLAVDIASDMCSDLSYHG